MRIFQTMLCIMCSGIWILCLKNSIANKKIYLFCVILALVSSSKILLFVSSVGFILFRTNGYYAYMVLLVILFIIFLRGLVLNVLNVVQPDKAESLSIPLQQIGRYVKDGGTLSDSEIAYYNSSYSNGSIYIMLV